MPIFNKHFKFKKISFLRAISLALLMAFIGQDLLWASPDLKFEHPTQNLKWAKSILPSLPETVVKLEDAWKACLPVGKGPDPSGTVILIQDAHTNPSGQMNLAKTLDLVLSSRRDLSATHIFLEAGTGDDSLSYLRKNGSLKDRQQIAMKYLKKGELHGEEYLDLTSNHNITLWGVEDKVLYLKALRDYKVVASQRSKFQNTLDKIKVTTQVLKPRILNPLLLSLEDSRQKFQKGELSFTEYADFLLTLQKSVESSHTYSHLTKLGKFKGLEQKLAARKVSARHQKAIVSRLLKASKALDYAQVLSEQKALELELFQALIQNEEERRFIDCIKLQEFYRKLFNFSLTPEEYKEFKSLNLNIQSLTGFLNRQIMSLGSYYENALFLEPGFDEVIQKAEDFYGLTLKRDEKFVENMLSQSEKQRVAAVGVRLENTEGGFRTDNRQAACLPAGRDPLRTAAVLITGGYHTPNLKNILKSKNISYISLIPQVTQETNQKRYEKILFGQNLQESHFPKIQGAVPSSMMTAPQAEVAGSRLVGEIAALPRNSTPEVVIGCQKVSFGARLAIIVMPHLSVPLAMSKRAFGVASSFLGHEKAVIEDYSLKVAKELKEDGFNFHKKEYKNMLFRCLEVLFAPAFLENTQQKLILIGKMEDFLKEFKMILGNFRPAKNEEMSDFSVVDIGWYFLVRLLTIQSMKVQWTPHDQMAAHDDLLRRAIATVLRDAKALQSDARLFFEINKEFALRAEKMMRAVGSLSLSQDFRTRFFHALEWFVSYVENPSADFEDDAVTVKELVSFEPVGKSIAKEAAENRITEDLLNRLRLVFAPVESPEEEIWHEPLDYFASLLNPEKIRVMQLSPAMGFQDQPVDGDTSGLSRTFLFQIRWFEALTQKNHSYNRWIVPDMDAYLEPLIAELSSDPSAIDRCLSKLPDYFSSAGPSPERMTLREYLGLDSVILSDRARMSLLFFQELKKASIRQNASVFLLREHDLTLGSTVVRHGAHKKRTNHLEGLLKTGPVLVLGSFVFDVETTDDWFGLCVGDKQIVRINQEKSDYVGGSTAYHLMDAVVFTVTQLAESFSWGAGSLKTSGVYIKDSEGLNPKLREFLEHVKKEHEGQLQAGLAADLKQQALGKIHYVVVTRVTDGERAPIERSPENKRTPAGSLSGARLAASPKFWRIKKSVGGSSATTIGDLKMSAIQIAGEIVDAVHGQVQKDKSAVMSAEKMKNLLSGIIDNALDAIQDGFPSHKYEGAEIEIEAIIGHGRLILKVSDNGAPFSNEAMANAGRRRFTTKDPDFEGKIYYGGNGIFLKRTSEQVRGLGGKMSIRNFADRQGSCVSFNLPFEVPLGARLASTRDFNQMSAQEVRATLKDLKDSKEIKAKSISKEWQAFRAFGKRRVAGVVVVRKIGGRWSFLMARRTNHGDNAGLFTFPAGKKERGEPVKKAASRELSEEGKISVNSNRLKIMLDEFYGYKREILLNYYVFVDASEESEIAPTKELDHFTWVPLDEIILSKPGESAKAVTAWLALKNTDLANIEIISGINPNGLESLRNVFAKVYERIESKESAAARLAQESPNPFFTKSEFEEACRALKGVVVRTPLRRLERMSKAAGKPVFLKNEAEQIGEAFKIRGVYYQVYCAVREAIQDGFNFLENFLIIFTQSTGNHGIAMILSVAKIVNSFGQNKILPIVFTFKELPPVKRFFMEKALGEYRKASGNPTAGKIVDEVDGKQFEHYSEMVRHRNLFKEENAAVARYMSHADPNIMLGHGSAGIEIHEQLNEAGIGPNKKVTLILPIGAGGPLGIAAALKLSRSNVTVVMVQCPDFDAFVRTLRSGKTQTNPKKDPKAYLLNGKTVFLRTLADGIAVDGPENERAVEIAREFVDLSVVVDDAHAVDNAGVTVYRDLQKSFEETRKPVESVRVGGTAAIAAQAIINFKNRPEIKNADAIVVLGTEGNVIEELTEHLAGQSIRYRDDELSVALIRQVDEKPLTVEQVFSLPAFKKYPGLDVEDIEKLILLANRNLERDRENFRIGLRNEKKAYLFKIRLMQGGRGFSTAGARLAKRKDPKNPRLKSWTASSELNKAVNGPIRIIGQSFGFPETPEEMDAYRSIVTAFKTHSGNKPIDVTVEFMGYLIASYLFGYGDSQKTLELLEGLRDKPRELRAEMFKGDFLPMMVAVATLMQAGSVRRLIEEGKGPFYLFDETFFDEGVNERCINLSVAFWPTALKTLYESIQFLEFTGNFKKAIDVLDNFMLVISYIKSIDSAFSEDELLEWRQRLTEAMQTVEQARANKSAGARLAHPSQKKERVQKAYRGVLKRAILVSSQLKLLMRTHNEVRDDHFRRDEAMRVLHDTRRALFSKSDLIKAVAIDDRAGSESWLPEERAACIWTLYFLSSSLDSWVGQRYFSDYSTDEEEHSLRFDRLNWHEIRPLLKQLRRNPNESPLVKRAIRNVFRRAQGSRLVKDTVYNFSLRVFDATRQSGVLALSLGEATDVLLVNFQFDEAQNILHLTYNDGTISVKNPKAIPHSDRSNLSASLKGFEIPEKELADLPEVSAQFQKAANAFKSLPADFFTQTSKIIRLRASSFIRNNSPHKKEWIRWFLASIADFKKYGATVVLEEDEVSAEIISAAGSDVPLFELKKGEKLPFESKNISRIEILNPKSTGSYNDKTSTYLFGMEAGGAGLQNISLLLHLALIEAEVGVENMQAGNKKFEVYQRVYESIHGAISDPEGFVEFSLGTVILGAAQHFGLAALRVESLIRATALGARMALQAA